MSPGKLEPVEKSERCATLDLVRGFALFGVLLVNLLYFFRVSVFEHILHFHSHPGWVNRAVDVLTAGLLEFKAFDLFSLMFGVGIAVQAERGAARGMDVTPFLFRRFSILLVFGALHMLLISNVDILALYAVCGLAMIPLIRLPSAVLAVAGIAAVYLPSMLPHASFPDGPALEAHVAAATHVYGQGTFVQMLVFRWRETQELILPLLIGVGQKTFGLMLVGVVLWRSGVVRDPQRHRVLLLFVFFAAGIAGAINTIGHVAWQSARIPVPVPAAVASVGAHVPLAFAYGTGLLLWGPNAASGLLNAVAAAGRMALSNYLGQSIVLSVLFYGYGLGLFGRLSSAQAVAIGVGLYGAQLVLSSWWLKRFRFGPFEWVWRSLSYGRVQPMRLQGRKGVVGPAIPDVTRDGDRPSSMRAGT